VETRLLPMLVDQEGVPWIKGNDKDGQEIVDYLSKITREAGLNAAFVWDHDEIVIMESV